MYVKERGKLYKKNKHGILYIWRLFSSGLIHREDAPAVECINEQHDFCGNTFTKYGWYKNGLSHREDGPAIVGHNGCIRYAINGKFYSERKQFLKALGDKVIYINNKPYLIDGRIIKDE